MALISFIPSRPHFLPVAWRLPILESPFVPMHCLGPGDANVRIGSAPRVTGARPPHPRFPALCPVSGPFPPAGSADTPLPVPQEPSDPAPALGTQAPEADQPPQLTLWQHAWWGQNLGTVRLQNERQEGDQEVPRREVYSG